MLRDDCLAKAEEKVGAFRAIFKERRANYENNTYVDAVYGMLCGSIGAAEGGGRDKTDAGDAGDGVE